MSMEKNEHPVAVVQVAHNSVKEKRSTVFHAVVPNVETTPTSREGNPVKRRTVAFKE